MTRRPLDRVLVDRGLAGSLEEARALVAAGRVLVGGAPATTPARAVDRAEPLQVVVPERFVGRGGVKLDGALEAFAVDVTGSRALDVGSSTGGFTDCLLSRGARRVLAVDVGRHQLHERLRTDPRVVSSESTNVRDLEPGVVAAALGGPPTILVADLSFTSLGAHAGALVGLADDGADLVVLVKPQFEVDRATASRGRGVVTDPDAWRSAIARCASAFESAGAGIMGIVPSQVRGASGNVEFFLHAVVGAAPSDELSERIDRAIATATP